MRTTPESKARKGPRSPALSTSKSTALDIFVIGRIGIFNTFSFLLFLSTYDETTFINWGWTIYRKGVETKVLALEGRVSQWKHLEGTVFAALRLPYRSTGLSGSVPCCTHCLPAASQPLLPHYQAPSTHNGERKDVQVKVAPVKEKRKGHWVQLHKWRMQHLILLGL